MVSWGRMGLVGRERGGLWWGSSEVAAAEVEEEEIILAAGGGLWRIGSVVLARGTVSGEDEEELDVGSA